MFLKEGVEKYLKIFGGGIMLSLLIFFLFWSFLSVFDVYGFFQIPSSNKVFLLSYITFLILSFVIVSYFYSKYNPANCPRCGKKLFIYENQEEIRCFKCGRELKVDWEKKILIDKFEK